VIIGVTGGSGSGKSSFASLLGYELIDADNVYHTLLSENDMLKKELTDLFGSYERKDIASIVFTDDAKLEKLNIITFKYTVAAIVDKIPSNGNAVIDAPLLFESGLDKTCDVTIAVLAKKTLRIQRIMARDAISREQAETRINAQKPDAFYIKNADYIIHNNGDDMINAAYELKEKLVLK